MDICSLHAKGSDSHAAATRHFQDFEMRNGLADLGHSRLLKGDTPTAMKSTGIAVIISRIRKINEDESGAIVGIGEIRKPLCRNK
jgi:hypothetical protein